MLWPVVLPFKITVCVIAAVVLCATLAAPLANLRRTPTFLVASLVGLLAFIPSCTGIMSVLDAQRFGVFTYASFDDVNDFRVERYLPPDATDITVDKYAQGFRARFTISEPELSAYLDHVWARYGEQSTTKRGELSATEKITSEYHDLVYGDLRWPLLEDASEFHGPMASNGAGFSIWFSPSRRVAYQRGSYW